MAYTPTQWTTGDDVTATKLNKMENGIANAGNTLIVTDTSGTLDKTFAEIYNALADGISCFVKFKNGTSPDLDNDYTYYVVIAPIVRVYKYSSEYRVFVAYSSSSTVNNNIYTAGTPAIWSYSATDSQSYPTFYREVSVLGSNSIVYNTTYR